MSLSRKSFAERIGVFREAVSLEPLVSKAPSDKMHNEIARFLRNGTAVAAFAVLEDFTRARLAELFIKIPTGAVKFDDLPERLRGAATISSIAALGFQADMRKKAGEDYIAYSQKHAGVISSTSGSGYQLSELSFLHGRSNISAEDLKDILNCCDVKDPWGLINKIAARVGIGGAVDLKEAFVSAAKRRHRAAHKADYDAATSDLANYYKEAVGIAVGYDVVLSRTLRLIREARFSELPLLTDAMIQIGFLDQISGNEWLWKMERAKKAKLRGADVSKIRVLALAHARKKNCILIERDIRQMPTIWHVPEMD
jgi:hypothetical protein